MTFPQLEKLVRTPIRLNPYSKGEFTMVVTNPQIDTGMVIVGPATEDYLNFGIESKHTDPYRIKAVRPSFNENSLFIGLEEKVGRKKFVPAGTYRIHYRKEEDYFSRSEFPKAQIHTIPFVTYHEMVKHLAKPK